MTVATTPPPVRRPRWAQWSAMSAMIWSPSTIWPFSSQITRRSASPSRAMPMSARYSLTIFCMAAGEVEPTSSLMLKPSGATPTRTTSAPSS